MTPRIATYIHMYVSTCCTYAWMPEVDQILARSNEQLKNPCLKRWEDDHVCWTLILWNATSTFSVWWRERDGKMCSPKGSDHGTQKSFRVVYYGRLFIQRF